MIDPNYAPVQWPFTASGEIGSTRAEPGDCAQYWGCRRRRPVSVGFWSTAVDVAAEPLDHDAFDITDASTAAPAATARRVRDIATASGYTVDSVHVTSSGNLSSLRDALTECGFDDVVSVPLTEATRAWARDIGHANAMRRRRYACSGKIRPRSR